MGFRGGGLVRVRKGWGSWGLVGEGGKSVVGGGNDGARRGMVDAGG